MNNNEKFLFHEALTLLIQSANINGGRVTMEEINSAFEDIVDDDSKYSLIYKYLTENNITIDGYNVTSDSNSLSNNPDMTKNVIITSDNVENTSEEDSKMKMFVDMYYNDVQNISILNPEEEVTLLTTFVNDGGNVDKKIIDTLVQANLNNVIMLSEKYINKGLPLGDLIQEGNIGLIEGISTYNDEIDLTKFHNHLTSCIVNSLENAVFQQSVSNRVNTHVTDRANELDRASVELSKKLDRTPTLEELSKYLSLPSDEIEQIMKMSLNALTIHVDG